MRRSVTIKMILNCIIFLLSIIIILLLTVFFNPLVKCGFWDFIPFDYFIFCHFFGRNLFQNKINDFFGVNVLSELRKGLIFRTIFFQLSRWWRIQNQMLGIKSEKIIL